MLVAMIFMLAILILSMAVAIPRIRASIQRDREVETMERGKQYIRAVQLYYRKFGRYPPNLDALEKTNNIRFLRKKYIDPTTGKDEWKPILFGQNKTPQAMGFFGQPLAAASGAGIGPSGGNGLTGTPGTGATSPTGVGLFNSNPTSGSSTDSGTGATPSSGTGTSGSGTDANGNPTTGGTPATGGSPSTTAPGSTSSTGSTTTGTTGGTTSGQTFGGGGIIGFSPQSPRQSILVYKKKNHYNEWEFLYSPLMDRQTQGGGNTGAIGTPASNTTIPVGGQTTPTPPTPITPSPQ